MLAYPAAFPCVLTAQKGVDHVNYDRNIMRKNARHVRESIGLAGYSWNPARAAVIVFIKWHDLVNLDVTKDKKTAVPHFNSLISRLIAHSFTNPNQIPNAKTRGSGVLSCCCRHVVDRRRIFWLDFMETSPWKLDMGRFRLYYKRFLTLLLKWTSLLGNGILTLGL